MNADNLEQHWNSYLAAFHATDGNERDQLLAVWSLYKQDGNKVQTGYNFVRPDQDGRFGYMAGFF